MVLKNVLRRAPQGAPEAKRPKNEFEARLMVFLMYMRLKGAEVLRKLRLRCASGAPQGILIVVFDVFDFLCQFQAFHVFLSVFLMNLMMKLVSIIIFIIYIILYLVINTASALRLVSPREAKGKRLETRFRSFKP
ncbi:hypothetical protein Hanom_Chr04g00329521 [Helianthus anomalus]